ncbi:hypothetical protein [Sphingomonas sp. Leaf62]|uniref:hypothetical protein n=1 Tax=Sphingomonas sp. Leaf62 TaxID=1736228 RepID=UPI0006F687A4|nr:hypothetical protein [Sphingomonas sp. Leaf62]KQN71467.1 hypothetical protein ASE91_06200 [Sphingomonas sp. Leaf62]
MKLGINQRRVFNVLERIAAEGAACPTNAALAERIGGDISDTAKALADLRRLGVIDVVTVGKKRQLTIVATGAQTASIERKPTARERRAEGRA